MKNVLLFVFSLLLFQSLNAQNSISGTISDDQEPIFFATVALYTLADSTFTKSASSDDRGFFREVVRCTDPFFVDQKFGQWSHSKMTKNVVKAWHFHHNQVDWGYIPVGRAEVILYDLREDSPTHREKMVFELGEGQAPAVVRIPPGVAHGCQALQDDTHLSFETRSTGLAALASKILAQM